MAERRMPPSDTVWLYSEFEGNHQAVSALIWTETRIDPQVLRDVVSERLVQKYPTFRQKVRMSRNPLLMPHWEDDPDFDLDNHVHVVDLPAPADKAALEALVSAQRSKMLDRGRPLWEIFLIQGYNGASAVHARIQHAIADGWALVRLVLSLADEPGQAPQTVERRHRRKRDRARGAARPAKGAAKQAVSRASDAAEHAAAAVGAAATGAAGLVVNPRRAPEAMTSGLDALQRRFTDDLDPVRFLEYGQVVPQALLDRAGEFGGRVAAAGSGTKDALEFLMPPRPGRTILHGKVNGTKSVAWNEPVPLQPIKDAGRSVGATINDVLLGALTNALRQYLLEHDALTVDELLTSVPISLRRPDAPLPRTLGNRFGLIPVMLPVGLADPLDQIDEIKRQVDEIKGSQIPIISFGLTSVSAVLTPEVERFAHKMNQAHSIGVTTNVPGPRGELRFAGAKVLGMWGMGGNSGDMNLVFGIFSLNGELNFAVQSDTGITSDPERILELFADSIDLIVNTTRQLSGPPVDNTMVSMSTQAGGEEAAEAVDEWQGQVAGITEAVGSIAASVAAAPIPGDEAP